MIPVYKGKVVINLMDQDTLILALTQEHVDDMIRKKEPFSKRTDYGYAGFEVDQIRFDDQKPVVVGQDTIYSSDVPGDLLVNITLEPQFVSDDV